MMGGYWIVTGATGVLGKAIIHELIKVNKKKLLLTSTNPWKLNELKSALVEAYVGVNIEIFAADLAKEEEREQLFEFAKKFTFGGIINVAGIDNQMPFIEYTQEKLISQTRVNFEAAAALTLFALNHSEYLRIVNISSVSGEQPLSYFQLYSATKSALTSLSLALDEELRDMERGQVLTVIAGGILTRDDVKAYIHREGCWGRKAAKTPEYVATKCIKALRKGKKRYVVGTMNRITLFVGKFIPRKVKMRFMAKRLKTSRKNYY